MRAELSELSRYLQSRRDTSQASDDHLVTAILQLIGIVESQNLEMDSLRRQIFRLETHTGTNL